MLERLKKRLGLGEKPRAAGLYAGDGPDLAESFVMGAILRKLKRLLSIVVKRVGGK